MQATLLRKPRALGVVGLDRAELALLALLAVWAATPLVLLFAGLPGVPAESVGRGTFTGSGGLVVDDHAQYIAWIREAGDHVLFSNRFDTLDDPRLFLHPMWLLSGVASKLGLSLQLAFGLWKPVGLAILLAGFALYVRRLLAPGGARVMALALALFFASPAMWLTAWAGLGSPDFQFGSLTIGLELFAAGYLWDLVPTAVSVGLIPLFLLGAERLLDPRRRVQGRSAHWYAGWTAAGGLTASWLHPWQGLTLLAIAAGLVAWGGFSRRYLPLAVPVAATALPLVYYLALSFTDSAWQTVSGPNGMPHVGAWLFAGLAPLALLALPGLRERPDGDLQERMLRLWPLAALTVYFTLQSSFFYHALAGLTLPLAVLAVRGLGTVRLPRTVVVATVLVLTLPGMAFQVDLFREGAPAHFLTRDESKAMRWLAANPLGGAVLASPNLAVQVPAMAGRRTWFGHATWTPANGVRRATAEALFSGQLPEAAVRDEVRRSRAAFLLQGCVAGAADLRPALGLKVRSTHQFGCARVYELREAGI